ncbi:MAG: hypothetical protein HYW07_22695 [Candidatus Latescibacteria bacterium]|nr:hypothetical protein [Candidatus Latescibacterota bacterium]
MNEGTKTEQVEARFPLGQRISLSGHFSGPVVLEAVRPIGAGYECREHLEKQGYSTCQIHGGMNPHERKRAQEEFRTSRQICVATEAAGEGINLQFCRLMINYDLPWNPTRLEQRLGRIHRIGQDREVHAFNFVASESEEGQPVIEGRILDRLLEKLEEMRAALADRVFDVIGEVLSLNEVNLPDMLREAAHDPRRLDEYLDQIGQIDPGKLQEYEQATRIALARANAAKFVQRLCRYPSESKPEEKADIERAIKDAQRHILEAHAERLSQELGKTVTVEDILEGRAPRPKVLDMFAGGGAIPLEALRLGCEVYALDLNPVAHIIELCTLVYPQKYGKPDPQAKGCAKDGTWAGLAEEVRYWGEWVLKKVKAEIGDLYPMVPDPAAPKVRQELGEVQLEMAGEGFERPGQQGLAEEIPTGYLVPVAYLWTRTVQCKNPSCQAIVPLVKQTWLCKKEGRYVALKVIAPKGEKRVRFEVVEARSAAGLGFDPEAGSKGGNATCPFCGTVAGSGYVKEEGCAGRIGQQLMVVVFTRPGVRGKVYLPANDVPQAIPDEKAIRGRIEAFCERAGLTVPDEPIEANPRSMDTQHFGFKTWGDLFTSRQMLCLLTFVVAVREAEKRMGEIPYEEDLVKALLSYFALVIDRLADWNSSLCSWSPENTGGAKIGHTFGRQALPMVWDFAESAVWGDATGSVQLCINWVMKGLSEVVGSGAPAVISRGSATSLPSPDATFDAIITDPPCNGPCG